MMLSVLRSKVAGTVCFLVLLCIAIFQLRISLIEQSAFSGISGNAALRLYQRQPLLLTGYARQAQYEEGDFKAAEQLYKRALVSNPLYVPAWLGLCELRNDAGQPEQAMAIFEYVDTLTRDIAMWRWDKAMVAYQLGRSDILSHDLAWLVEQTRGRTKNKVLKFAFSLWEDPEELLDTMGRQNLPVLFHYAVRNKEKEAAEFFWDQLDHAVLDREKDILPYVNLLISSQELEKAAKVWRSYYNADTMLYNGSFEEPPIGSGFGWRFWKIDGIAWDIESMPDETPSTALHLHFTGTHNVNFSHARQYVVLTPGGVYLLTGKIRGSDLTTDQKPYLEVVGFQCNMPMVKSGMVESSGDWTEFSLPFIVPYDCQVVQVRVRRIPSRYIDNLISGDFWLTDLQLQQVKETTTDIPEGDYLF